MLYKARPSLLTALFQPSKILGGRTLGSIKDSDSTKIGSSGRLDKSLLNRYYSASKRYVCYI